MAGTYLQPAASLGLSRRRWPRIDVGGRLQAQIALLDLAMAVRDISRGGFAVESPVRFAHGESHELLIHTSAGETFHVRARAVYCHARRDRAHSFFIGWEALGDPATTQTMTHLVDFITAANEAQAETGADAPSTVAARR